MNLHYIHEVPYIKIDEVYQGHHLIIAFNFEHLKLVAFKSFDIKTFTALEDFMTHLSNGEIKALMTEFDNEEFNYIYL